MKITASFDSPDSADLAAGALKRALSPLDSISTKNLNKKGHSDNISGVFAAFNTASTTPTYSMPIYSPAFYENVISREQEHQVTGCILEVICRKEEESAASRIIIGHGGRNISKLR